jgi:excisionase family DNA binding protein
MEAVGRSAQPERLLTINEVSDWLRIKVPTLRKRVSHDRIPYTRIGRSIRFRREDIEAWLRENSTTVLRR